jgi:hypothetical protein
VKKGTKAMYKAPEIVAIGAAHDLILGQKPFSSDPMDAELEVNRAERVADIDEVDE